MRYELDEQHKIVDFHIEDDSGREHRGAMGFDEAAEFAEELLKRLGKAITAVDIVWEAREDETLQETHTYELGHRKLPFAFVETDWKVKEIRVTRGL